MEGRVESIDKVSEWGARIVEKMIARHDADGYWKGNWMLTFGYFGAVSLPKLLCMVF